MPRTGSRPAETVPLPTSSSTQTSIGFARPLPTTAVSIATGADTAAGLNIKDNETRIGSQEFYESWNAWSSFVRKREFASKSQ